MQYNYYPTNPWTPPQSVTAMPSQSNNIFAWIQGEDAAKSYPVAPGNTVVLIDSDKPVMYMKTADLSGRPQPIQVRYLVSEEEYKRIQNGTKNSPNLDDFVTKEYFEERMSELDSKYVVKRRDK